MDKFPWGEFFTAFGILLIVFRRRFARSIFAFWEDRHYTETQKRALEILFLIIAIAFVAFGVMTFLMPSLLE